MNYLIVVDMQNDFVTGPLGTAEAKAIVPYAARRVAKALEQGEEIIFTRDTHGPESPGSPLHLGHGGLGDRPPADGVRRGPDAHRQARLWQPVSGGHAEGPG